MPRHLLLLLTLLGLPGLVGRAEALPDLVPEIASLSVDSDATVDPGDVAEGCAGAETGRFLIKYGLRTRNEGADDLVMGDPGCPDCPTNPGAACDNPFYECSTAHGHAHFENYVRAELLDDQGAVIAVGDKQGFCLLDLECDHPQYTCGFQGISAGCSDVYVEGLPCQYIDVTDAGLAPGSYTLRVVVDPLDRIPEANETNNVTSTPVTIGAPPPSCPVYTASDVPLAIDDLSTVTSTITAPAVNVDRVRVVSLHGSHTFMQDLEFRLRSPSGTEVLAIDRVCGSDPGFSLDLSDAAGQTIPCPPTDGNLYLPSTPLSAFVGEPASGTWSLEIRDTAGGDEGWLDGWGLEICPQCGNGTLDPAEICDDGNELDGDCCSAACDEAATDGTPCDGSPQCLVDATCEGGACQAGTISCDPCLVCDPPNGCVPPSGVLCDSMPARSSKVTIRKHPFDPSRDSLSWTWEAGTPVSPVDFGSPLSVTDLTLCVYDQGGLKLSATAPAAGTCAGKPCWQSTNKGLRYEDRDRTPDGIGQLTLQPGDAGKASIKARGQGAALGVPDLSFVGEVTVRLRRGDGTPCWQAKYPTPTHSDARRYKASIAH